MESVIYRKKHLFAKGKHFCDLSSLPSGPSRWWTFHQPEALNVDVILCWQVVNLYQE
jgi:hypothetical protein